MISWNDLSKTLERMNGVRLKDLEIQTCSDVATHYPIVSVVPAPASVVPAPASVVPAPTAPTPPAPTELPKFENSLMLVPEPQPREIKLTTAKNSIDPIVLGINLVDPLYEGAPYTTRHNIEKEIAVKLESELDGLYKSNNGRSRGWTKVGLESMIKPRCASGGDLKEIDRAKKPFLWALSQEDKGMSAFLDFVCCARRIHTVVMDTEKKIGYLFPAADNHDVDSGEKSAEFPLFLIDMTGHPMFGIRSSSELLTFVDKNGWKLQPPNSVVNSLGGLKMEELESVGKRLGMSNVEGSKATRVAAIAEYKIRARLAH